MCIADKEMAYLKAVECGDLETMQQMVEDAAKQSHLPSWFIAKYPEIRIFGSSLLGKRSSDIDLAVISEQDDYDQLAEDVALVAVETGRVVDVTYAGGPVGQGVGGYVGKYVVDSNGIVIEDSGRDETMVFASEDFFQFADPAIYDDKGEIVPLSMRFNGHKSQ